MPPKQDIATHTGHSIGNVGATFCQHIVQSASTGGSMPHVFLSYSSNERLLAEILEVDLNLAGHPTWRDKSSIEGGSEWADAIEDALLESYAMIVVLSDASRVSEWVEREMDAATASQTPIIPVRWDEGPIPDHLADLQAVDFSKVRVATGLE
jgi:hypothetical protein